jgi:glutathione peroxidase
MNAPPGRRHLLECTTMIARYSLVVLALMLMSEGLWAACGNLLDYTHRRLASSQEVNLCEAYAGQVIVVVNTASRCGFTSQFEGLEALYQKYREQGLMVLGFPSDDFRQEMAEEEDTAEVCYINFGVTFPVFATSSVRGDSANPLFQALNDATAPPRWNFTKYLIDRDGKVVERYGSRTTPLDSELEARVQALLKG